jgi:hypothetical protein
MKTIKINDSSDYECVADDIISDFMERLTEVENSHLFIREPNKEEEEEGEVAFIYTDRAIRLYKSYCSKLTKLGMKLFPDEEIVVSASYVKEF